jgi:nitrate reductase gamma subunit
MHALYQFVAGPLAWVAFIVFVGGCLFRLIRLIQQVNEKERFIYSYMSWKYSLRSIGHWITPFATENMRRNPFMTIVTFAFHICLLLTPIFLLSHIVLVDEGWGLSWWALPDGLADLMTLVVIGSCVFFMVRRQVRPEVQYVTSVSDYVILAIVAAPFLTGLFAYHQWLDYRLMLVLHILSGEIMLMAIPFTRLSHMVLSPLTRAYMGSEFGGVRKARDW